MPDTQPTGADRDTSLKATIKRTGVEFVEDEMTDKAAGLTYYGLLSLFPALIALVSIAGTWRQTRYGNVSLRDAMWIGLLSPVGVLAGVLVSNAVSERVLRIGFALLALYMAWRLLKRAFTPDDPDRDPGPAAGADTAAPGGTSPTGGAGLHPDGTGSAEPRATGPAGG